MIKHLLIIIQILFIFIKSDIIEDCEIGNYCTNGACSTNVNCKIDIFNFTYNPENIGIESICQCNYGFSSYDKDVLKLENSEILCCYEQKSHFTTFMLELFLGLGIGHFYIGDVKYGFVKLFSEVILCFVFCCSTYIACNKEHTLIINLNEIKKDEYKINKDYFDKTLLKKKLFLDKCSIEELKFHRKLLKTKSCEIEPYKELLFEFDAKKTEEEAELAYDRMFELCKSSIGKKSFEHFFKNMKLFQTGANKEEEKKKFEQKNSQEYNSGKEFFDINNIYVNNNWNYTGNNYIFKNNEKNINLLDQEYGFLINRERELKIFKRKIKIK